MICAAAAALALLTPADMSSGASSDALAVAPTVERWRPYIAEASRRFGIPEAWIAAVMKAESGGLLTLNGHPITSHADAMGLMQLMPATYAAMRAQHRLGPDPHDPRDNILAGAAYLRAMYDRFGYPGLFAAYNAGPARYAAHLRVGRPLPGETRAYIASLAPMRATPSMPPAIQSGGGLFFTLGAARNAPHAAPDALADAAPSTAGDAPRTGESGGLFVILTAATDPDR